MSRRDFLMLTIGLIGYGRVTAAFGSYLTSIGHHIIYNSNHINTNQFSQLTNMDLKTLIQDSEIIFIGKKDDQIADMVKKIQEIGNRHQNFLQDKIIGHFSGSLDSRILAPLTEYGAKTFSLHPMMAFPDIGSIKNSEVAQRMLEAFWTLESLESLPALETFLQKTLLKVRSIRPEGKSLYHAGAVMASNYMVSLLKEASQFLVAAGIEQATALEMLIPLSMGAILNVKASGLKDGLTGPIKRGDLSTVTRHIDGVSSYIKNTDMDAESEDGHLSHRSLALYGLLGEITTEIDTLKSTKEQMMTILKEAPNALYR